ncbi:MAG: hypothetical protein E7649_05505 [Ruminococcaceae bacterium]|nr:hypothetical protein [Oscillospiraceae bacterium]
MSKRWTKERAWEWYNRRPWLRGCNYMPSDAINHVDQWQALHFDDRIKTAEKEVALMKETGYNTVRIFPSMAHVCWLDDPDGFMERLERYISLFAEHSISCMIVLANDCMPPKTPEWKMPYVGEQSYDVGYHGGVKRSQHGKHTQPAPHFYLDNCESAEKYYEMVRQIVTAYKDDERICVWDVYNEPGNSMRRNITLPNLKRMFETVRAVRPIQPLTCGLFMMSPDEDIPLCEVEEYSLKHSDIITYHYYGGFEDHVRIIKRLKKEGRPLMNTEWMGRCLHNTVFDLFPLFYMEKIGSYNWGFVAGKYQTYEPWEVTWERYANGEETDVDFTVWFHDLYRPNHRPYDPREIDLIKKFCLLADKDFDRECKERKEK